jgi:hypothetical protein
MTGMRYKVSTKSLDALLEAKALVEPEARIWVISRRRKFLSTGDLPERLKKKLQAIGANVSPDIQYQADAA